MKKMIYKIKNKIMERLGQTEHLPIMLFCLILNIILFALCIHPIFWVFILVALIIFIFNYRYVNFSIKKDKKNEENEDKDKGEEITEKEKYN